MKTSQKFFAELLGTFILVLGGCGTAVFASSADFVGILGVALAFGLTIVAAAYAIGHVSGAHLNPAVSLGLWAGGRLPGKDLLPYIVAQLVGATIAAAVLFIIVSQKAGFDGVGGFAANGYGEHSPGGYGLCAALIAEFILTFVFLLVILGVTDKSAPAGFAGLAIGLTLALIHLISIPITNTSVNPARSISQALFADCWAMSQLWVFILAPVAGALVAGVTYKKLFAAK
ncbi:MAG: aquaporin Z [Prevotellaceae bacterium]|jgi:aquaporin Z|nr:aquaporin Z [Prevotellaceae bacterium]